MRSMIKGLALLASLGQINCNKKVDRFFVNDNDKHSLTIPCVSDGADQINANSLYLIHWFRTPLDAHGALEGDSKDKLLEARPDRTDENNFNTYPDTYQVDLTSGALTILQGSNNDGTVGLGDQALFECHMTLGEDIAVDESVLIVVVTRPEESELKPDLVDIQPTQDSDGVDYVYNQDFAGNLVTCQAGHAKPQPDVKWKVVGPTGDISFLDATSGLFSSNPLLIDDDDTDQFHAAELPLSLITPGVAIDLSKYHLSTFTCIVTYDVADDNGKLIKQPHEQEFATIKIKHPVTAVTIKVNGNELANGIVDLSYDEKHIMSCESNGYPAATIDLSATDVSDDLQTIKDAGTGAKVSVTCTAKNVFNKEPVEDTVELEPSYVSNIVCKWTRGARIKDKDTVTCSAEGSEVPDVRIYSWDRSDPNDMDTAEERKTMLDILSGRAPVCPESTCSMDKVSTIYAVATISDKGVTRIHKQVPPNTVRAGAELTIETKGVPKWEHTKDNSVTDADNVRFWHSTTGMDAKPEFTEITGNTEDVDYPEDGSNNTYINRHVPYPSGGQYVVCYDLGDAEASVKGCQGETFELCAGSIHDAQEDFCTFFDLPAANSAGGPLWLWIIIVIILLIVIAAIVWWIRQKQQHDDGGDEGDEETPKLQAHQTGTTDAVDEFAVDNQQETDPMMKEDEQQSSRDE